MRYAIATTIIGGALLLWLLLSGPAGAGPQATHAGSVETTPCPAPQRIVRMALSQYRAAGRARDEWARAKRCLGEKPRLRVAGRPSRDRSAGVWLDRMEAWGRQHRDFDRRLAKLMERMRHPGGNGMARWWPAAKWMGWPDWLKGWFLIIGMRESSGSPRVQDYLHSGHWGLFQLAHGWWGGHWAIDGKPRRFDPCDVFVSLYWTLRIRLQEGTAPWAL